MIIWQGKLNSANSTSRLADHSEEEDYITIREVIIFEDERDDFLREYDSKLGWQE